MESKSKVYVLADEQKRIIRCEGEYTLSNITDFTEWVLIEEGPPCDRLNLAQSHYFPGGLSTEEGIPRYKLEDGKSVLRSDEEIQADRDALGEPEDGKSLEARIAELEENSAETREALELLLSGVTE